MKRNRAILIKAIQGVTYQKLADEYNLSTQRIFQIVQRGLEIIEVPNLRTARKQADSLVPKLYNRR